MNLRKEIDLLDEKLIDLYIERLRLTDQVGEYKSNLGLNLEDKQREKEIVERAIKAHPAYKEEIEGLYQEIFKTSKKRQEKIIVNNSLAYGLLGEHLGHSYSPEIHKFLGGYDYGLFEVKKDDLKNFLKRDQLKGLNVTMPHKINVLPYMDGLSYEAKKIGAVNTIKFKNNRLYGYNTDYYGVKKMILRKNIQIKNKKVLVLGTGATSQTVTAVLEDFQAKTIDYVSRKGPIDYENMYDLKDIEVIVNTTPVGMYPNNGISLVDLSRFDQLEAVLDVIYNPFETRLVFDAKNMGLKASGGLAMLVYQAKKTVEIFLDKKIPDRECEKLIGKIYRQKRNIVLVGMPGSGKSTIGRKVAKILDLDHIDTDRYFEDKFCMTPSQAIKKFGEASFRDMEEEVVREVGQMTNKVISTGGGVVTRRNNHYPLKQNGYIIYVKRSVDKLSTRNRPLSQGGPNHLLKMEEQRREYYEEFADIAVNNNRHFNLAVDKIINIINN